MFINVALSSFTFLITTSFTAGPETLVPVDLSLVSRGELILAPGVITKVPVTFERLIGVMVSGKNCHKLNILEHENREICTFWQIWEFQIVVLSKKIIHFILMVWAHSPGNPQFGFGAQKNICGFWFDIGIWPPMNVKRTGTKVYRGLTVLSPTYMPVSRTKVYWGPNVFVFVFVFVFVYLHVWHPRTLP